MVYQALAMNICQWEPRPPKALGLRWVGRGNSRHLNEQVYRYAPHLVNREAWNTIEEVVVDNHNDKVVDIVIHLYI